MVIALGNHDLDFKRTSKLKEIQHHPDGSCNFADELCYERIDNNDPVLHPFTEYIKFFKDFYSCSDNYKSIDLLSYYKKIEKLNIAVINSCWAERDYCAGKQACIACKQVKYLLDQHLKNSKDEINIAVLHHPYTKICESCIYYYGYGTVLNELYKLTDLVLCGHMHAFCEPSKTKEAYECIVGNGDIKDNTTFAIYCIDDFGKEMSYYKFTFNDNEWTISESQDTFLLRPKKRSNEDEPEGRDEDNTQKKESQADAFSSITEEQQTLVNPEFSAQTEESIELDEDNNTNLEVQNVEQNQVKIINKNTPAIPVKEPKHVSYLAYLHLLPLLSRLIQVP